MSRSMCALCTLSIAIMLAQNAYAQDGIATTYPMDQGIGEHPAVLLFLNFDDEAETLDWIDGEEGYGWTGDLAHVFSGGGALEIQQTEGTHIPYEIHPELEEVDVA